MAKNKEKSLQEKINYFAALPAKEIGSELVQRVRNYYQEINDCGRAELLINLYNTYNRPANMRGYVGRQGKYAKFITNHFRNLIAHRMSMTVNQRPHFEPKAANTDYKSQAQVSLASGLLEYYNRIKKMERFTTDATEKAIVYGEAFVAATWNPTSGEQFGVNAQTGAPLFEGDIEFKVLRPFDLVRSIDHHDNNHLDWVIVRERKNRYNLAAKYEELAEDIVNYSDILDPDLITDFRDYERFDRNRKDILDELVTVFTFYHRPSEALPQGRMVEFIGDDLILHDGPIPYRNTPVFRIAPGEEDGLIWGYSASFDVLPLQQALDKLNSTILTNQAAFGVQNIMSPKGSGLNINQISEGLNHIKYDAKLGPPQALQLTATPSEVFGFIDKIESDMEKLMGLGLGRGEPPDNVKSGSFAALLENKAITFAQQLQQSYVELLEDLGTAVVQLLQDYATVPRVAMITGKSQRSYMKEFKSEDIGEITRVIVDIGNPMTRTAAGRMNLAETLIQQGFVQTPQQFMEVLNSGRLEPVTESELAEVLLIRAENEDMQEGQVPAVLRTDNHALHIQEHLTILADPDTRKDPQRVAVVLQHIQEHEMFLAPPVPEAPLEADAQQLAADESVAAAAATPVDPNAEAAGVNLPNLPTNPLTGEEFDPTGGQ